MCRKNNFGKSCFGVSRSGNRYQSIFVVRNRYAFGLCALSRCVFRRYVFSQRVFSRRAFSRCVFARCVFGACERRWTGGWGIKKKGARDERWCCPVVAVNSHVSRCRAARRASVAPAPSAGSSRRTYSTRASAAAASSRRRSTARRLWNATGWVLLDGLSVSLPFSLFLLPCVCLFFSLARYLSFSVCILRLILTYSCVCISVSFLLTRVYSVHREPAFSLSCSPSNSLPWSGPARRTKVLTFEMSMLCKMSVHGEHD